MTAVSPALRAVLERAQAAGMLGPEDVGVPVAHALGFMAGARMPHAPRCVDLGSGAGVPGLPLALALPESTWVLLDAWEARCDLLERAIRDLSLEHRVSARHARAEDAGHGFLRGSADLVVARSFGSPPVTAECAGPLLAVDGLLVVSVASDAGAWPDAIAAVGLTVEGEWTTAEGSYRSYRRSGAVDARLPRRPAARRRRPLF